MFSDLPLPSLFGLIAVLLFSLSWHEAAHAWMANRLGDHTARDLGRVTLNPLKHLDPFLSVILPGILLYAGLPPFGGGKPVPIDVRNFRRPSRDFMLVAIAGPLSNLVLSALFGLFFLLCVRLGIFVGHIDNPYGPATPSLPSFVEPNARIPSLFWLQMGFLLNISLALFNLLPLPPLDGSRIIGWLLPGKLKPFWYRLDRYALFIVAGIYIALQYGAGSYIFDFIEHVWFTAAWTVDTLAQHIVF
jgi:Zn-dependent protease